MPQFMREQKLAGVWKNQKEPGFVVDTACNIVDSVMT
jgi:hypothetical protein